jgi:DNA primase
VAGRIPQSFIDDLLARVNIVDVVDSRVRLKKAGKNHSACCPFHNEKTPSFTVASDKQFYYCFGCGAKGNAVGFVMEFDNIDFPEAVELLAGTVGLEVPKEEVTPYQQQKQQERVNLYELTSSANEFYQQQLRFSEHKQAPIDYLKNRGLSGKAAKFFNIGFSPPGWDHLKNTLGLDTQKQPDEEKTKALIDAGLLIKNDNGRTYDRFRNRIMYPIRDMRGRCIGFGARTLGDDKPKYLNSPETPIFNKGHELYGLYECRQIRQTLKRFLVVEGYMDVVALHEFGIHYAVATLGTATSETHLQKLFKIAPEIVFCFDGDEAGRRAAKRGLEIVLPLLEDGQQIRFMFLPDGEDPDSLVRKEGKDGFELRMKHAQGISEFLLDTLKKDIDDPESLDGRARLAKTAGPFISQIPGLALKSLFWQVLSEQTHIDTADLKTMAQTEEVKPLAPPVAAQKTGQNQKHYSQASSHSDSQHADQHMGHDDYAGQYDDYQEHHYDDYEHHVNEAPAEYSNNVNNEPKLVKSAIALIMHTPSVVQTFDDLSFLTEFTDHNSQLLHKLIEQLQKSPCNDVLQALSLLSADKDLATYRAIVEDHNKRHGKQTNDQVTTDCLVQLRLKAAKQIKTRLIKQAAKVGNFKQLQPNEQQLFSWASAILELDILTTKLNKAGGKLTDLSPPDQEKYRQLTGQSS